MQHLTLTTPVSPTTGTVLIIGGGVAGVQTALDMTSLGLKVYLVEKSAAIGGVMARLDKTFPTNDCSLCILAPKLVEAGRDANIDILTRAEIVGLSGEPGNFTATIRKHPRYIDETTCTGCGQCAQYCLKQVDDDYNENLAHTSAIHIDYAQAVPATYAIDPEKCLRLKHGTCGLCAVVCQKKAINFDEQSQTLTITIGAVVLAPGFGRVKQEVLARYGWGKFPDVVTAFENERLMCASGPTNGEIVRPSDRKHPKKIAFLQCIGSRDESCDNNYCSSVCSVCTPSSKPLWLASTTQRSPFFIWTSAPTARALMPPANGPSATTISESSMPARLGSKMSLTAACCSPGRPRTGSTTTKNSIWSSSPKAWRPRMTPNPWPQPAASP
jgi:heterodisulfide reductase subunit A